MRVFISFAGLAVTALLAWFLATGLPLLQQILARL